MAFDKRKPIPAAFVGHIDEHIIGCFTIRKAEQNAAL
jgi:hypothetical protein